MKRGATLYRLDGVGATAAAAFSPNSSEILLDTMWSSGSFLSVRFTISRNLSSGERGKVTGPDMAISHNKIALKIIFTKSV
jgi:hypothetical protein